MRTRRNWTMIRLWNWTATNNIIGITPRTTNANLQLMIIIKNSAVVTFMRPQVTSSRPQVTNSEILPESEVTRDMIQPTGVRSKYENDNACRLSNIFFRRS